MVRICKDCGKKIGTLTLDSHISNDGTFLCGSCYRKEQEIQQKIIQEKQQLELEKQLKEKEETENEWKQIAELVEKIKKWKGEGYKVDDLEQMIKPIEEQKQKEKISYLGYYNKEHRFGLNPPEGWIIEEKPSLKFPQVVVQFSAHNKTIFSGSPNFGVAQFELSSQESLRDFASRDIAKQQPAFQSFSVISKNERKINCMNAYEIVFTCIINMQVGMQKIVYIEKNNKVLALAYASSVDNYELFLSDFEKSLNSLIILR